MRREMDSETYETLRLLLTSPNSHQTKQLSKRAKTANLPQARSSKIVTLRATLTPSNWFTEPHRGSYGTTNKERANRGCGGVAMRRKDRARRTASLPERRSYDAAGTTVSGSGPDRCGNARWRRPGDAGIPASLDARQQHPIKTGQS